MKYVSTIDVLHNFKPMKIYVNFELKHVNIYYSIIITGCRTKSLFLFFNIIYLSYLLKLKTMC